MARNWPSLPALPVRRAPPSSMMLTVSLHAGSGEREEACSGRTAWQSTLPAAQHAQQASDWRRTWRQGRLESRAGTQAGRRATSARGHTHRPPSYNPIPTPTPTRICPHPLARPSPGPASIAPAAAQPAARLPAAPLAPDDVCREAQHEHAKDDAAHLRRVAVLAGHVTSCRGRLGAGPADVWDDSRRGRPCACKVNAAAHPSGPLSSQHVKPAVPRGLRGCSALLRSQQLPSAQHAPVTSPAAPPRCR